MLGLRTGVITKFNDIHGVGFIEPDDGIGVEKIKFSYKNIKKQGFRMPNEGQIVEFELIKAKDGKKELVVAIKDDEKQL